jgi:O-antigen biosynthesis protein WbqP
MKRFVDLVLSGLGLLVAWPFMIVIAVAIRLTSKGPAIFVQDRVGLNEAVFKCLKFRTMVTGSPNIASHDASTSWITPVGKFLRRTKLDELPQLINVLLGQMSIVGPRPCLPSQTELIGQRRARGVFSLRPGITGPAQIAGIDMSDPVRLAKADAEYVQDHSLAGDLRIMILTVVGSGGGDAVAR